VSERDDAALLRVLQDHRVPHVVIGGWAVITHGYVRYTRDVDVLIPDTPAARRDVARALSSVHARRLDGQAIAEDSDMPEQGWQLETDYGRIDVLLEGEPPLDFAGVQSSAIETTMDGVTLRVADLPHLVAFKRLAGRPHDRVDLDELAALNDGALPLLPVPGLDEDS
jgi:predicted nucleotidyltransferase